jgi:ribosomal protein L24E
MCRVAVAIVLLVGSLLVAGEPAKIDQRKALQPFNSFIAPWKGTGVPDGTREEKQAGFWTEMVTWQWQFEKDDAWLQAKFDQGRFYVRGELRGLGDNRYKLMLETKGGDSLGFEGELKDNKLTLDRVDPKAKESQRLTFRLLHSNRVTYTYETKAEGKVTFVRKYQVGLTNQNEPFANNGSTGPECIISGGLGTMQVSHKGKTYYVCCSGCRDEFKANPEKYIAEWEAKQKAKKKE